MELYCLVSRKVCLWTFYFWTSEERFKKVETALSPRRCQILGCSVWRTLSGSAEGREREPHTHAQRANDGLCPSTHNSIVTSIFFVSCSDFRCCSGKVRRMMSWTLLNSWTSSRWVTCPCVGLLCPCVYPWVAYDKDLHHKTCRLPVIILLEWDCDFEAPCHDERSGWRELTMMTPIG